MICKGCAKGQTRQVSIGNVQCTIVLYGKCETIVGVTCTAACSLRRFRPYSIAHRRCAENTGWMPPLSRHIRRREVEGNVQAVAGAILDCPRLCSDGIGDWCCQEQNCSFFLSRPFNDGYNADKASRARLVKHGNATIGRRAALM